MVITAIAQLRYFQGLREKLPSCLIAAQCEPSPNAGSGSGSGSGSAEDATSGNGNGSGAKRARTNNNGCTGLSTKSKAFSANGQQESSGPESGSGSGPASRNGRMSKAQTLRATIDYIRALATLLAQHEPPGQQRGPALRVALPLPNLHPNLNLHSNSNSSHANSITAHINSTQTARSGVQTLSTHDTCQSSISPNSKELLKMPPLRSFSNDSNISTDFDTGMQCLKFRILIC